jgi:hypothetical protein
LKAIIIASIFFAFVLHLTLEADGSEVKLISPIGAAIRSVVPGWGQFYTHSKLEGVLVFLSVGVLTGSGVQMDARYRDLYNNEYRPAVLSGSSDADFYFDESNQYYKLSRFLFYTAAGIWAYSVIDAYVDAHIYNAKQQARSLDIDNKGLEQLKLSVKPDNSFFISLDTIQYVLNNESYSRKHFYSLLPFHK